MSDINPDAIEATIRTSRDLYAIAATMQNETDSKLSSLTLPEIQRLSEEIARIVPAGNVPGLILSGLARLDSRTVEPNDSRKYVELLFRGARQSLDKAVYETFFAMPARALYAYQQLLRLAGKDPEAAFPEGTWQFYLEFALREDSARHANETTGFHTRLLQERIALMDGELLGAWMLAAAEFAQRLPEHLENEWRERVLLKTLADTAEAHKIRKADQMRGLYPLWEKQRPYTRKQGMDYITYRRQTFEAFWHPYYAILPSKAARHFDEIMDELQAENLPAYQRQMSWLAYLEPGTHNERRVAYDVAEANFAVIYQGRYYLMPLREITDTNAARSLANAILAAKPVYLPATIDEALVKAYRSEQVTLRRQLDAATQQELELLRRAPIVLNWDLRDGKQPLAYIRQGKRGIGDHALTIFRTVESLVFDQSHIFFDGAWGAAVAQIMTNEAIVHAQTYAEHTRMKRPPKPAPYSPALQASTKLVKQAEKLDLAPEASAENSHIQASAITEVRKLLKQRSEQAQITVNDLLILYRGLHSFLYRPSPALQQALDKLASDRRPNAQRAYQVILEALNRAENRNPAILIPIDASRYDPRDRVFPTTFRNPITEFWDYHQRAMATLTEYRASAGGNAAKKAFNRFDEARALYLRLIGGFGELLARYKDIALRGESTSTATIKFMGNLSGAMQKLLNTIPGRFDVLNEIIKGEEVFSNTGRVAAGASLRRFITAKDDNEQKTFAWGVQTDDYDTVHISLRDFRPHVRVLHELGVQTLAQAMTQDYLNAYADGLNVYVHDLREIVVASIK